MDFTFSDEQQQLADTLKRYLDKHYGFAQRQQIIHSAVGVSQTHWQALAELGLMALPVPAGQGGFDGSAVDMLGVMQALGSALVVEPYWATMVGAEALRLAGTQSALLEQVAAGTAHLAVAFGEPASRYDLFEIAATATRDGDAYAIDGAKAVVWHGAQADHWIVPARLDGAPALFLIERAAAGAEVSDYRTIDGMRAANLVLRAAPARVLGTAQDGAALLEQTADYGIVLLCAEALGILDALHRATLDYTRTRRQFGVPIAHFQALQHRLVEMLIHIEQARSITYLAAVKYAAQPAQRRHAAAAAKARVGQAARFVGQQAVQLHGGMGLSNEMAVAHLFKRLSIIETTLGDTDHHLARFAALPGFACADTDT
jgi:alkylation response protein AidB-like acyl-CoA dehydrogenase